jgi:hypothetical protein
VIARDSKNATGPQLAFSGDAWLAFVEEIKHGELDL